jgi:hypothetical protein
MMNKGQYLAFHKVMGRRMAISRSSATSRFCTDPVGAGLLAMAARQPTNLLRVYQNPLWEPSLLAMAAWQPTNLLLVYISIPAVTAT